MKVPFLLGVLTLLFGFGLMAESPFEAPVTVEVRYLPRSGLKAVPVILKTPELIAALTSPGGEMACSLDGVNRDQDWIFKRVVKSTVPGGPALKTDLSGKIQLEVLGKSAVGSVKPVQAIAPKQRVQLGMLTETRTVKLTMSLSDGVRFEFWGSLAVKYTVFQEAGQTDGVWIPSATSLNAIGVARLSSETEWISASLKMAVGVFKPVPVSPVAVVPPGFKPEMVSVEGGRMPSNSAFADTAVEAFQIGRYEVTWGEWLDVRTWAVSKGYDLAGVGGGSGDRHPVRDVSWMDAVKWCNARSEKEGISPVYRVGNSVYRGGSVSPAAVTATETSKGYRLPTELEWEWAGQGGKSSRGYRFSGGSVLASVGWFFRNSAGADVGFFGESSGTWPAGLKSPNELGLFDMSGNVREYCWETVEHLGRRVRGGAWNGGEEEAEVYDNQSSVDPESKDPATGFRLARSI
jgi:formylglycine-generating enzyme required for sulfatase activity